MCLARFSTNLQRKIDLIKGFTSIFRDDSFKLCSKIAGYLGKQRLGCRGPQSLELAASLTMRRL